MRGSEPEIVGSNRARETAALRRIAERLGRMKRSGVALPYRVPQLWAEPHGWGRGIVQTDAVDFWREAVDRVLRAPREDSPQGAGGEWTREAVVYNAFLRTASAFDHDEDGVLQTGPGRPRETGSLLKTIALLPYIRSLGCNVLHLLPIASIGKDGRKGPLGSPYAIRDPYSLDGTLAEPLLGLGPDVELRALVEAAHRLGMRVVVEFVFRTAARDAAWAIEHPDWFYWIRADVEDRPPGSADESRYGSPVFAGAELDDIKARVGRGDFGALPPPHAAYRDLFVSAPEAGSVRLVGDRLMGRTQQGTEVRVPGAFSDWPPDDTQPPWSDVTYLRLYARPEFDYIAYNTVRMYDARLASPDFAVTALWDRVAGVLPHYVKEFGIDGAMIDMGHALPRELKRRIIDQARTARSDFAFWDEDFALRPESRSEGYNAAVGNLWWAVHRPSELREAIRGWSRVPPPLPFFATPETHNTPRCAARPGGAVRARLAWVIGCFLPAVPFVHGGFELGETQPVNTGLDFAPSDLARYPTDTLPLTSPSAFDWGREFRALDVVRQSLAVRREAADLVTSDDAGSLVVLDVEDPAVLAYTRQDAGRGLVVFGNASGGAVTARIEGLPLPDGVWIDRLSERAWPVERGTTYGEIGPWECCVLAQLEG